MERIDEIKTEVEEPNESNSKETDFVVRIRGLPWSASKEEILKFFEGCDIKDGGQGIHLTMSKEGRPSGEAYVEFTDDKDYKAALSKDNEHLGSRYIEVFQATKDEMDWALRRCGLDGDEAFGDACVRLRGLPFGCSKEEIAQFFTGLEIVRNGITLPTDFQGRSTGEAYVQFASQEIAENAMGKHKEKIGHRYIEIFKSSLQEIRSAIGMGPMRMRGMGANRLSPYDRMDRPAAYGGSYSMGRGRGRRGGPMGGGYGGDRFGFYGGRGREDDFSAGYRVHMRGLPYRAVERDIYEFFAPLNPVCVNVKYEPNGRSSGEADVEFATYDEALKAMKRDKEKIQHRYIELFLHPSASEPFRRGGNGYDGYPQEERPYGMDRSFPGGRGRPFPGDGERNYPMDRGFGPSGSGERGYGGGGDRGYARGFGPGGNDRGFGGYTGSERSFGSGGSSGGRSFGGSGDRTNMGGDRSYGMGGGGGGGAGEYRNGMNSGSSGGGGYRNDSGYSSHSFNSQDAACKDDSEFYGSGKLFGDNNFQPPMSQGMMGGNNYTSF